MKKKVSYIITIIMSIITVFPIYAKTTTVTCGKIQELPLKVLELSNTVINIMQIAVPVILVIMGTVDLVKAVSSQKDDDIKKAQGVFIKRLIMGALVYFVVVIVKLLISIIGNNNGIWGCVECFVSNASKCK